MTSIRTATAAVVILLLAAATAQARQCQVTWSSEFPPSEPPMGVRAWATFDDGSGPAIYAAGANAISAGSFTLARWRETGWELIGDGTNGQINALAVHDDGSGLALYAAGAFTIAGELEVANIARWSGTAWSAVGGGFDGPVRALAVFDDGAGAKLYAGGEFQFAEGQAASRVARWDGTAWSPLGTGLDAPVSAMAVFNPGTGAALFVGGEFSTAGGQPANRLARWSSGSWTPVDTGMIDSSAGVRVVRALAVFDDALGGGPALYVGGAFEIPRPFGEPSANSLAKWNGQDWAVVGSARLSLSGPFSGVHTMASFAGPAGRGLYVGGRFTATSPSLTNIGCWDGQSWSTLDGGTRSTESVVQAVASLPYGNAPRLFVGGTFGFAGPFAANGLCTWTGTAWAGLGNGSAGGVARLLATDENGPVLYAFGRFQGIGAAPAASIARWDGDRWHALGSGITPSASLLTADVHAVAFYNDGSGTALFAAGRFETAGGQPAANIAKWNGTNWSPLGNGLNGSVLVLAVHDDGAGGGPALYATGNFTIAGTTVANRIARWNGSVWSRVSTQGLNAPGTALCVFDADGAGPEPAMLYAGGAFTQAGGVPAMRIARWNGSAWAQVGAGLSDTVHALALHDDGRGGPALYAAGAFGGRVARWSGSGWVQLLSGLNAPVDALSSFDPGDGPLLLASGNFGSLNGEPVDRILTWDGSAWTSLDSGADGTVSGFAVERSPLRRLYVAGSFRQIGGFPAGGLAVLVGCPSCYPNCDNSTTPPVLNVNDFACFLNRFVAGDAWANCDGSSIPPVLNVNDFLCFMARYAAGCP